MSVNELRIENFDERFILYGDLYNPANKIHHVRCNFVLNELYPNRMTATISAIPTNTAEVAKIMGVPNTIIFESINLNRKTVIEGYAPSMTISSQHDEMLKFPVSKCTIYEKSSQAAASTLHTSFKISKSKIYSRTIPTTTHYRKGFLVGWTGLLPDAFKQGKDWLEQETAIQTNAGVISFSPAFHFQEAVVNGSPSCIVIEHLIVESIISGEIQDFQEKLTNITNIIDQYLYTLSFLECTFISWYHSKCISKDKQENIIEYQETYRHVPMSKKALKDDYHFLTNRERYIAIHPHITESLMAKGVDEKTDRENDGSIYSSIYC